MRAIQNYGWPVVLTLLLLSCAILLAKPVISIPFQVPRDWNEGYYAYLQMRALGPEHLYPDSADLVVNSYPPLSFYVVAIIGSIIGDNIIAGRVVALVGFLAVAALIGLIVHRICRELYPALFAGLLFVAIIALVGTNYVAMNDPQWLAQTIMMTSVYLLVARGESGRWRLAALLLMLCAGLTKHNIVAFPLAAGVWVFLEDRRSFFRLALFAMLGVAAIGLVLYAAYGTNFFHSQVFSYSEYSYLRALTSYKNWLTPLSGLIGAFVVFVLIEPPSGVKRLLVLYVAIAAAWGLYVSGVSGMDVNHIFDLIIGLAITTGITVHRVGQRLAGLWPRSGVEASLAFVLCIFVLLAFPTKLIEARWALSNVQLREAKVASVIRRIAEQEGPVMCETMALCYWAGKKNDADILVVNKKLRTGEISESAFRHLVDTHHFRLIQLHDQGTTGWTNRLPKAANAYLLEKYSVAPNEMGGAFLTPRAQDASASGPTERM